MQDTTNESDNNGHLTTLIDMTEPGKGTIAKLPVNYTDILPVDIGSNELFVPTCNASLFKSSSRSINLEPHRRV